MSDTTNKPTEHKHTDIRPRGHWINKGKIYSVDKPPVIVWECSECGSWYLSEIATWLCTVCGADMRGADNEDVGSGGNARHTDRDGNIGNSRSPN